MRRQIFNRMPEDLGERYHGLSLRFEDKRRVVPLQAADIAAWAMQNELPKQRGLNEYPQRTDMLDMLHRAPIVEWSHIHDELMRGIAAAVVADKMRLAGGLLSQRGWP